MNATGAGSVEAPRSRTVIPSSTLALAYRQVISLIRRSYWTAGSYAVSMPAAWYRNWLCSVYPSVTSTRAIARPVWPRAASHSCSRSTHARFNDRSVSHSTRLNGPRSRRSGNRSTPTMSPPHLASER